MTSPIPRTVTQPPDLPVRWLGPILLEAAPVVVALVGALLWASDAHFALPGHTFSSNDVKLTVALTFPLLYVWAGFGWATVGFARTGCVVGALHGLAAMMMYLLGGIIVNGRGELSGPGPGAPIDAFYASFAFSLFVSAASLVGLAAVACRRALRGEYTQATPGE